MAQIRSKFSGESSSSRQCIDMNRELSRRGQCSDCSQQICDESVRLIFRAHDSGGDVNHLYFKSRSEAVEASYEKDKIQNLLELEMVLR
jgi:hypothetical protein